MKKILFFFLVPLIIFAIEKTNCPVCGMKFPLTAKTRMDTIKEGKPTPLCSFSCANKVKKKEPKSEITVFDFNSKKALRSEEAFYLAKSKELSKHLEFNMPPAVVAFEKESDANDFQKKLGDGVVVKGFEKLRSLHE